VKGASSLWRKLASWQNSRAAFLQRWKVYVSASKSASLRQNESYLFTFDIRVSSISESRISTSDEVRVSKAKWPLRLQDLCSAFTSASSSTLHWWKQMTIPLIQQYTNNQLRALRRSGLRIQILTVIISGGFKEFNSTLTKTKIQTRSSSRYLRRLPLQSWELAARRKTQSISKPFPVNRGVLKTLDGGFVDCLKITEDKSSDSRCWHSKKTELPYSSSAGLNNF